MPEIDAIAALAHRAPCNLNADLLSGLFDEQIGMIRDPSRTKAAVCSRRAGKTWGVTRYMAHVCNRLHGSRVGYLTKTRDWAEELVWEPLKHTSKRQGLGAEFHSGKLRAVWPNRSVLRLAGAKDKSQAETLRGFAYDLLVIDEAGSIDPVVMRYVVREILPAALGERRGSLLIVGTPNPSCSGWFHDMTNREPTRASIHRWTQRQNVMFPRWAHIKDPDAREREIEAFLAEEREVHGLSESDPEYQREYCGIWARDETLFIFRITPECLAFPPKEAKLRYVLSIDLGWEDFTAWELVGYDAHMQKMWEVDSQGDQHLTMDEIGARTVGYMEEYRLDKIVVDAAGAGKIVQETIALEYARRHGVPCEAAQKQKKAAFMKYAASDMRTGRAHLLPDGVAADQLSSMEWDDRRLREKEPKEGTRIDNADAWLYGYRECYHYIHEPREDVPEVGTAERLNWEMSKHEQHEAEMMDQEQRQEWWESI